MWENSGSKRLFSINQEGGNSAKFPSRSCTGGARQRNSFFFLFRRKNIWEEAGGHIRRLSEEEEEEEWMGWKRNGNLMVLSRGGKAWVVKMGSERERKEKFGSVPCPPKWV